MADPILGKMDRVQRVLALDDQVERALWLSRARALRDPREEPAGREPAHGDGITRIDLRTLARRPEGVRLSSLVLRERGAVSSDFDRDQPGPVGHGLILGHELDGPIDISRALRAELPAERYRRKKVLAGRKGRPWGTGHRGQDGSREQHEGKRKTNHTSLYASSRPGRLLMYDLDDEVAGDADDGHVGVSLDRCLVVAAGGGHDAAPWFRRRRWVGCWSCIAARTCRRVSNRSDGAANRSASRLASTTADAGKPGVPPRSSASRATIVCDAAEW